MTSETERTVASSPDRGADTKPTTPSRTMTREDWDHRYGSRPFIWSEQPNGSLVTEVEGLVPGKVLDLGAGEGRHAVWLAEQGWTVHAVDFSEVAIGKGKDFAEARGVAERVAFENADLLRFTPEPRAFDLVIMMYIHFPVDEMTGVIARAARAVAPGGRFVLIAHDSENLEHGVGGPPNAEVLYTADFVASVIGGDLEIEKAMRITRPVKRDGSGDGMAIDCLVRARRP